MTENKVTETTKNNIRKATFWSFAAEVSAKIIAPIINMILARILAPEAFGIIATLNIVITFADTFSSAGFQKYIVQHQFENDESLNNGATVAFWTNLFISFVAWLIIAIFRNKLSEVVGSPGYGIPLMVASLSLPLTSLSSVHEGIFQKKLEYRVLFIRRLIVSFIPLVITVPLALFGLGYWALIVGTLVGNLFKFILFLFVAKWRPSFFYNLSVLKEMLSFCSWTLCESITMWACTYVDVLIISNRMGDYYTGLYKNSQTTVTGILAIITGATTSVLFASLSKEQEDNSRFQTLFYAFQKYVAILVLPLGVGIFCFRDFITMILLGSQWAEASIFVGWWGLCTSLVCVFGTFSREVYRSKGNPRTSLIVQILHLIFIVPVCIIFVNKGFEVLVVARSVASLQIIVVHMFFMKFCYNMSPYKMIWSVKEPIACSIVMGGIAYFLQYFVGGGMAMQFLFVLICAIVYFFLLAIFKEYRKIMKGFLQSTKRRVLAFTHSKQGK